MSGKLSKHIRKIFERGAMRFLLPVLALLVVAYALSRHFAPQIEFAAEDVSFAVEPSAAHAFALGTKHFDARDAKEYDVRRAKYFFEKTYALDPNFAGVNHQLARIDFLHSDFVKALDDINQELKRNPDPAPESYYMRALIYGYMGEYDLAAKDYEHYFKIRPASWAGINDYSWVLLKADLPQGAHAALSWGLKQWPKNAWLLNNDATALYELGRYAEAKTTAQKALPAVQALTEADWLNAYPGNDPLVAKQGLADFKKASQENLEKIIAMTQ
jgi:tetratricopeptide (TPR) repeat protein